MKRSIEGARVHRPSVCLTAIAFWCAISIVPTRCVGCDSDTWLQDLRSRDLAFEAIELQIVRSAHDSLKPRQADIAKRYAELKKQIKAVRDSFAVAYSQQQTAGDEKSRMVKCAEKYIVTAIKDLLMPLWLGGEWDFNGYSSQPQSGYISCGWFVQRVMEGAGFSVKKEAGRHIAHLAPAEEVWSYAGEHIGVLTTWDQLDSLVSEQSYGVYILGIERGWGHMGFLVHEENRPLMFCHAGPSPHGLTVAYDNAENYLTEFMPPEHFWAVKIDADLTSKWLRAAPILPFANSRDQ